MRIYTYLLLAILIFLNSCDKDFISDNQADSFVKYYGGGLKDEGMRVLSLDNGGYLLMGNITTPNRGIDICVILTDKFGNSTSPAMLYGGNFDDYGWVIKKNNKGYIIGGSSQDSREGKKNILLVQIDVNGVELARNKILFPRNEEVYDLLVLEDQSLVLTGYTTDSTTNKYSMLYRRTDDSLKSTYSKFVGVSNLDEVAYSICKTDEENSFMLAGYSTKWNAADGKKEILVAKKSDYTTKIYRYSDDNDIFVASIIPAENNNYFLVCNTILQNNKQIKLMKVDFTSNINQLWGKNYGGNESYRASYGIAKNDMIYIIGTSGEDGHGNVLFLEIQNDGNLLAPHLIGDGSSFSGFGFDFAPNQGIIITGSNKQNENSLITLIKLKSDFSL